MNENTGLLVPPNDVHGFCGGGVASATPIPGARIWATAGRARVPSYAISGASRGIVALGVREGVTARGREAATRCPRWKSRGHALGAVPTTLPSRASSSTPSGARHAIHVVVESGDLVARQKSARIVEPYSRIALDVLELASLGSQT
jgi:hypothetical protein